MMPLARKAYVHLPGAFSEPHRRFPFQSPCCSWTGPCGSYSCKRPSAIPTRELLKQAKCVTHGSWFYTQSTVWEHSQVMVGRERERENAPMQAQGVISTGVKGGGVGRVLCVCYYLASKAQERKHKWFCYLSHPEVTKTKKTPGQGILAFVQSTCVCSATQPYPTLRPHGL